MVQVEELNRSKEWSTGLPDQVEQLRHSDSLLHHKSKVPAHGRKAWWRRDPKGITLKHLKEQFQVELGQKHRNPELEVAGDLRVKLSHDPEPQAFPLDGQRSTGMKEVLAGGPTKTRRFQIQPNQEFLHDPLQVVEILLQRPFAPSPLASRAGHGNHKDLSLLGQIPFAREIDSSDLEQPGTRLVPTEHTGETPQDTRA